jgi:alkylation response protein AidB-like acyl-CoA dehydrogenase
MYLIYQNGEACISCPLTCTEGLVAIIEKYADTPELKNILQHCKEGIDGNFAIGAQYLSEIQGGSDVPANVLEAVNENGIWKLYGTKFFCSATHADYAMVTAKPQGSEEVGLFVVPSWLPGNKEKEKRNGYTIDRIKWKMGTSELTTAELTLNGAVAYQVGPLNRGLANVVGVVLTFSRLTVGLGSAAYMARVAREAKKYAEFREAFGLKIGQFPLLAYQLNKIERNAKRTTAGTFKLYKEFLNLPDGLKGGLVKDEPEEIRQKRFEVRELIMLQKIAAAWDSTDTIRDSMSVFGGHGVMEDFSSLPRLYRDSAVNELWEGPRNVLLTQMHRDFQRASEWYDSKLFVANILRGSEQKVIDELSQEMAELLSHPNLFIMDEATMQVCERWDKFCHNLYHAYQDLALKEVEES